MFDCEVKVVDMIMGAGKTSAAINYINNIVNVEANLEGKEQPNGSGALATSHFLYITPYLSEVSRIIRSCPLAHFKDPQPNNEKGSKLADIKKLFNKGENIVSTHALFQSFDRETINLCRANNYTLIMDEVTDVIEPYSLSEEDFNILKENFVDIDSNGFLHWRENKDDYNGKFAEEKTLCELNCLAYYGGAVMMWLFPIEAFNAFRHIYILTYMFKAQMQCYYYDYFGLPYTYLYVKGDKPENFTFTENKEEASTAADKDFKSLIHILDNEKMNSIGERKFDLSERWYKDNTRTAHNIAIQQLKNHLSNFFRRICDAKASDCMWTTFVDFRKYLSGKGYSKGFVSLNIRASNNYRNRTCVAYPVNRFMNPGIKNFFDVHGITVDQEGFALSEMLQFLWRSAIRDGHEIWLYIPSSRMRGLLEDWINEVSVSNNDKEEGE